LLRIVVMLCVASSSSYVELVSKLVTISLFVKCVRGSSIQLRSKLMMMSGCLVVEDSIIVSIIVDGGSEYFWLKHKSL
jgi:hypothetical protein